MLFVQENVHLSSLFSSLLFFACDMMEERWSNFCCWITFYFFHKQCGPQGSRNMQHHLKAPLPAWNRFQIIAIQVSILFIFVIISIKAGSFKIRLGPTAFRNKTANLANLSKLQIRATFGPKVWKMGKYQQASVQTKSNISSNIKLLFKE